jgi:hypothetical protein
MCHGLRGLCAFDRGTSVNDVDLLPLSVSSQTTLVRVVFEDTITVRLNLKSASVILEETCWKTPEIYFWGLPTGFFQNDRTYLNSF